jgi:UDP-N-acetylmuramate--alanine ligase
MHIYFSGIGGVGMGPLAEIARDAGYTVSGSDIEEGLMSDHLATRGIDVHIGTQDGKFLETAHDKEPIDWFVYTPAITQDHLELVRALELGIKTAKRGEYLAHFVEEKSLHLIAISGTHGKTTTTGMVIWVAKQLGIPVSYSIGSTISFGPSGVYDQASKYFIYECDEFDRNFLYFHPYLSIIPTIDYDHPDTYPTEANYRAAFNQFIGQSQIAVTWNQELDDFSAIKNSSVVLHIIDRDKVSDQIAQLQLTGLHNRQNAYLVQQALVDHLGADEFRVKAALESFPGTDRRFEKLADNLYSDYGHHPKEIAATLQLAREISDHIVLVYQPHQNIRQHEIKDQYTSQFELADEIYWLPTYLSREDPNLAILTPDELIQHMTNKKNVHVADFNDELWQAIKAARASDKLVLCMGAGKIDGWLREHIQHES